MATKPTFVQFKSLGGAQEIKQSSKLPFFDAVGTSGGGDGAIGPYAQNGPSNGFTSLVPNWMNVNIGGLDFVGFVEGRHGVKESIRSSVSSSGGLHTFYGRRDSEVAVELWLWTPRHLADYQRLIPFLLISRAEKRAVTIIHPATLIPTGTYLGFAYSQCDFLKPSLTGGITKTKIYFIEFITQNSKSKTTPAVVQSHPIAYCVQTPLAPVPGICGEPQDPPDPSSVDNGPDVSVPISPFHPFF